MPESIISFLKGDQMGAETDYRDYLPVNMTPVNRPMFGAEGYMLEIPGLTQYGEASGVDRGGIWNEAQNILGHFRLSGSDFGEVDAGGNFTVLGNILGSDIAALPYSFETQAIIADKKYYLYDRDNGFRQVTDENVRLPIDGVWIDGYYLLTDGDVLYHTAIINGEPAEDVIEPLAIATAEFSPDPTLGLGRTTDNKAIAFNRYSIEYFRNVGGETFAFSRLPDRAIQKGLVATNAKAQIGGTWFFVGGPKEEGISVYVLGTGDAQKIATREVEKVLGKYSESELGSILMETREEDGYQFIVLHLPEETLMLNWTFATTKGIEGAWCSLTTGTKEDRWRARNGIFEPRLGKWVYGDTQGPNLAILDETVGTQYGEIQEWYLNTPFMYLEGASIDELEVETVPGFTEDSDATVFISLTYDGVFWGQEHTMEYGLPSHYGQRFISRRLGYVRDWVGIRLRAASRSRMAFHRGKISYG